jgi:hypothetical protein
MRVDEMFKKYPDNLIGFRIGGDVRIIDFWLDKEWSILDEHVPEEVQLKKQKVSEETGDIYYIMFTNLYSFEELYTILTTIIEYNLDLQRKQELFTEKMTELKGLFGKLSYDELRQISFDNPLSLTSPKKSKVKKNEPVVEQISELEPVEEITTEITTEEKPTPNKIMDEPIGEIKEIKMSDLGPIAELDEE